MNTKVIIEPVYTKTGSKLIGNKHLLLLSQRSKPTKSKPKDFLLAVLPNGQRQYISSLYSTTTPGIYRIDYLGLSYQFTIKSEEALCSLIP